MRHFALVALGFLALHPLVAGASAAPDPATLRAALADPVESNFVEAEVGDQGTLEGPFDLNAYTDYYRNFGISDADIEQGRRFLTRDGFVGGYGRQWYGPRTSEVLGELVMVFGGSRGAASSLAATKTRYGQDEGFQSFVSSGLGKSSFAATLDSTGYQWTVVVFAKGNDLFAVSRGSTADYRTSAALAQARRANDVAPASIGLPAQPVASVAAAARLALILVLILLLVGAATVSTVVVLTRASGRSKP